jgi:hypothetical protein
VGFVNRFDESSVEYKASDGNVVFYVTDMPNMDRWLQAETISFGNSLEAKGNLNAVHICSYICWLATAVGDPANYCHFVNQGAAFRNTSLCLPNFDPPMARRFPFLRKGKQPGARRLLRDGVPRGSAREG